MGAPIPCPTSLTNAEKRGTEVATAPVETQPAESATWFAMSGDDVVREFGVDPQRGLAASEVAARIERYGPNKFAEAKAEPRWRSRR